MDIQCHFCGMKTDQYICSSCGKPVYEKLIEDAKTGKEEAIRVLIQCTQNKLFHTISSYMKNVAIAEDILQETYINAFSNLDDLKESYCFENWLIVSAINRCKNYVIVKKHTEFVPFSSLDMQESAEEFEEWIADTSMKFVPEANFNYKELKNGLHKVIEELPDNQRLAILLYFMDGFKIREVAEILNVSQGTVKSLLNYGKKGIEKRIIELRRQNKSFYGIAPIPFLIWTLQEDLNVVHEINVVELVSKIQTVRNGLVAASIGSTIESIHSAIQGNSMKKAMFHSFSKGVSSKVAIGFVSATIVGGVAIGGASLINQESDNPASNQVQQQAHTQTEEHFDRFQYTVMDIEVPDFERTPIDDSDKGGYLVKVNNQYGFIQPDGQFMFDAIHEGVMLEDLDAISGFNICLFPDASQTTIVDGTRVPNPSDEEMYTKCGHGFGGAGRPMYLSVDNRVIGIDMRNHSLQEAFLESSIIVNKLTRAFTDSDDFLMNCSDYADMEQYYIVTPDEKIFGPYDASEKATFSINENYDRVQDLEIISGLFNSNVNGLFYEKLENGYRIWNKTGTESYNEIVDEATPISSYAMKIKKDGKMGIVNQNLELVLLGDFEDVSNVIDNRALVKINGKWKLIAIEA